MTILKTLAKKKIYETDAVKAFASRMSPLARRKYLLAKSAPEIRKSMEATQAELDVAMCDPAFKAEHEKMVLKYDIQEAIAKLFAKAVYAKRLASFSKRQCMHLNIEFGAGTPVCVAENAMAL